MYKPATGVTSDAERDTFGVTTKLIDYNKIIRIETDLISLETQIFVEGNLQSSGGHENIQAAVKAHLISSAALGNATVVNVTIH